MDVTRLALSDIADRTRCSGVLLDKTGVERGFFLTFFDERLERRQARGNAAGDRLIEHAGEPVHFFFTGD